jgi:hypothetical protein
MGMTGRADSFVWIALRLHFVPLFRGNDGRAAGGIVNNKWWARWVINYLKVTTFYQDLTGMKRSSNALILSHQTAKLYRHSRAGGNPEKTTDMLQNPAAIFQCRFTPRYEKKHI